MSTKNIKPRLSYQIVVNGELSPGWQEWLSGSHVSIVVNGGNFPTTTLTADVADQAALRGLANQLWDLNLAILSLNQVRKQHKEQPQR